MAKERSCIVSGFRFSAVSSGIKAAAPVLDLGLLVADKPAAAAAIFTQNHVQAAPIKLAKERLASGTAQAVLVNSGNANACTGDFGLKAAERTTKSLARKLGIHPRLVLPASTGVIGVPLPTERITHAIPSLVSDLAEEGWKAFSRAILTTDRGPKVAARTYNVGRKRCGILGIAKGAGMIHPNMATTLAFVVTDLAVSFDVLRTALKEAARQTFNAISVDGDTSTNDMILLMASGASGVAPITSKGPAYRHMRAALEQVLDALATDIVADGEGAEHAVTIQVTGLRGDTACAQVAQTVAQSLLVKTALYGKDPNWGRLIASAGNAQVPFDVAEVAIRIGDVPIVRQGRTLGIAAERRAARVMKQPKYTIHLELGKHRGSARYLTCDLGHNYVRINADYRS
ncbi:MAG: bifunctional glutamate N-acetyltransferase/amino-acid acetyltransferase ArgJ [Myxococcales bacterium]|nr:bifunctional glutamate N-acetyltransferase/amino-acid acetyltransferase ArgJ [Myxococcales bacterium]